MVRSCIFILLIFVTAFLWAQDTIQGSYSYTYGDTESLVEARQTCKNLAIRDAIESYYIFVESSTEVENFQLKEDIIQSISAGSLKDVKIIEQTEEGRTITMTIEATVMPDEVKAAVDKIASSKDHVDTSDEPVTAQVEDDDESNSNFMSILAEYDKNESLIEDAWNKKQFDAAIRTIQQSQLLLEQNQPRLKSKFQQLMHEAILTRTLVIKDLLKLEQLKANKKRVLASNTRRSILKRSVQLKASITKVEKLDNLTVKQKLFRKKWVSKCENTLNLVKMKTSAALRR